jgi:hypothetical protein
MTRYLLLFDSYGLVFVGLPLWREDGSGFCICCWPSPAYSFSGPSLLGFVTIFYFLRFETTLFVASYDSQGHGGGIRPRLYTGEFWEELIAYFPRYDTDRIEINASNNSSIVTFLPSRFLATIGGYTYIEKETDRKHLWSTPFWWAQVPWYTYKVS